jgi:hypothetical protein
VAVSPDGKFVAAGAGMWDKPGEVGVWNLATREPLQHFPEDLGVASVAFSPSGKLLASGSWSGHGRVYDWAVGKQLFDFPVTGVARVAFSPDGRLLATATEDQTVQLWDVERGKLLADLEGDLFRFHCVAFSPDGSRVLAGGGDWKMGGISLVVGWDVASRQQVLKLTGHRFSILGITYSPDGKTIATGSGDSTIRLWEADTGNPLKTLIGHGNMVETVAFSPDGKTLVSGSHDGTTRFWDVDAGKQTGQLDNLAQLAPGPEIERAGLGFVRLGQRQPQVLRVVRSVRFTPDGTTLLVGGGPKTLKVYTAADRKELAALWNGFDVQPAPMDLLPFASQAPAGERHWLKILGLLSLGLGFLVSLTFAVRLSLRHRRAGPVLADAGEPPAPLSFPCPGCGKKLRARAELAGKKVKCPQCGQAAPVPESPMVVAPSPPRRWWTRPSVLGAFVVPALLAGLFVAGLGFSREKPPPAVSRLQVLADRVRGGKINIIDARPFRSVADRDLAALLGLTNLRVLNLDDSEVTDEGMKVIGGLDSLVSLSLTGTQVTDAGLAHLKGLTRLEFLRLDRLPITDAGLANLAGLPRLRELSLYKTSINDDGLAHLKGLPSLEILSLDETAIGDEGLRHLKQCSNLKNLKLWSTGVTPAGIEELRKALPHLRARQ